MSPAEDSVGNGDGLIGLEGVVKVSSEGRALRGETWRTCNNPTS